MVAQLILIQDAEGVLRDQEDHLRSAARHKIDDQGTVIHDPEAAAVDGENDAANADAAAAENALAARLRKLADYNCHDQYYATCLLFVLLPSKGTISS